MSDRFEKISFVCNVVNSGGSKRMPVVKDPMYFDNKTEILDIEAVSMTIKSGALTQGPAIPKFEEQIVQYTGAKYAVAVSSATAGLHLAYLALGLSQGHSVLTSPITFVSTANVSP